jgi:hypothetical protein
MPESADLTGTTGRRRIGPGVALLLALLAAAGCAGMEPYAPRNAREEGPEKGLFTGAEGEFVIFRRREEPISEEELDDGTAQSDAATPE